MSNLDIHQKYREELAMVYPIADVLKMRLLFNVRKGKPLRVRGESTMSLSVTKGYAMDFLCKIHASKVSKTEAWVLAHVKASLWIFVAYMESSKEIYLWVIDADAVDLTDKNAISYENLGLDEMLTSLARGCVAVFQRTRKEPKWSRVDYVSPVDSGRSADTTEDAGTSSKKVGSPASCS